MTNQQFIQLDDVKKILNERKDSSVSSSIKTVCDDLLTKVSKLESFEIIDAEDVVKRSFSKRRIK